MTVTCDLDLLKHLRTLEGYGFPSVQNDLVEQAPHAVALFYTLILTQVICAACTTKRTQTK